MLINVKRKLKQKPAKSPKTKIIFTLIKKAMQPTNVIHPVNNFGD